MDPFTIASLVSTGLSLFGASKAKKKKREADRIDAEAAAFENKLISVDMLREYRQARAATLSSGVSSGASIDSSGTQGVINSIRTQRDTNLKNFKKQQEYSQRSNAATSSAQKYAGYSSLLGTASQVFGISGKLYGQPQPTTSPYPTTGFYNKTPPQPQINTSSFSRSNMQFRTSATTYPYNPTGSTR